MSLAYVYKLVYVIIGIRRTLKLYFKVLLLLEWRYEMKLKQWLKECCNMTYAEYKALEDFHRWELEGSFNCFNRDEQIRKRNKQIHDSQNWRKMTDEEKKRLDESLKKERKRYETNLRIGGIDVFAAARS